MLDNARDWSKMISHVWINMKSSSGGIAFLSICCNSACHQILYNNIRYESDNIIVKVKYLAVFMNKIPS